MSFEYPASTKVTETIRPQGTRPSSSEPQRVIYLNSTDRKEPADSGQLLPRAASSESADSEKVQSAVKKISDFVQNFQRDLKFSVDEASGRTIINVVDSRTKQVIRQIPSEESLRIAENMDSTESVIFSEQA